MDTIDTNAWLRAMIEVDHAHRGIPFIHTITVTLNGATGGMDVTIQGFTSDVLDEELTIKREIR